MNPRLKEIVFKKLNQDLSKAEIIVSENKSIWFINRANKHWYFELEKSGKLWWRYEFFIDFFPFFCLEVNEFQPLLSEWVEGILNRGVSATQSHKWHKWAEVEDILNCGVSSTHSLVMTAEDQVEDILNCGYRKGSRKVEDVLNREVNMTVGSSFNSQLEVEDMLNHKVVSISPPNKGINFVQKVLVNDLLIKIESASPLDTPASDSVDEVLRYKVTRTIPDLSESLTEIDILLNSVVPLEIP